MFVKNFKILNMETQQKFSEQQALQLIEQTILNTRQKFTDDGFSLVMWGWIVIIGNIVSYIAVTQNMKYLFLYWAIVCPVGGIISGIRGKKEEKERGANTFTSNVLKYIWIASGIAAIILWFAAANFGWEYINAAMFVAFAVPVFITGGIMKFSPAIYGGLVLFAFGILSFYIAAYNWAYLVAALGWVLGYLVPGYMLKKSSKK